MNSESKDDVFSALDRMDALLDRDCDFLKISYFSMTVKRSLADMQTIRAALGRVPWSNHEPTPIRGEMQETLQTFESGQPGTNSALEDKDAIIRKVSLLVGVQERTRSAEQFMQELSSAFEAISYIGDAYGSQTLADLMWLHSAILTEEFVGICPESSSVQQIVSELPSGDRWKKFLRDMS